MGDTNESREINQSTLPSYGNNSINITNNLLDLDAEDYSHMQNYLASNGTINFDNVLLPDSSNSINSLNKGAQENYLSLSSGTDLLSLPLEGTGSFYAVC